MISKRREKVSRAVGVTENRSSHEKQRRNDQIKVSTLCIVLYFR